MSVRPCPICRKPVSWETTPWRPFCSERCRTRDLAAWASEAYRVPEPPGGLSEEEHWSSEEPPDRDGSEP